MLVKENADIVNASYGRCLTNGNMFETFYRELLEKNPPIKKYFEHTDFESQYKLLRHGLNLILMHAQGNAVGTSGLERISDSHSRKKMNIPSHLYIFWKNAMLNTVSKHDPAITPGLKEAWAGVLTEGIEAIKSAY